jgi:signal peptidase I
MSQQSVKENPAEVSLPAKGLVTGPKRKAYSNAWVLFSFLAFVLFVLLNFKWAVVEGPSMLPHFRTGQRLTISTAYWLVGPIKDGDVIVIRDASPLNKTGYIIKRVYKRAGERVDLANIPSGWNLADGPFTVPENQVFVLGDNRKQSDDSRDFGPVPLSKVIGKVLVRS